MPGLTCKEVLAQVRAIANAGAPDDVLRAASQHCAACPRCAARVERERELSALLQMLSSSAPMPGEHVETAVRACLRSLPPPARTGWSPGERLASALGAAAAVLVIGVVASILAPRAPVPAPHKSPAPAKKLEHTPPPEILPARPPSATERVQPAAARAARRRTRQQSSQTAAAWKGFVPVLYGDQRPPAGPVVRVELPVTALGAFGAIITESRPNKTVEADVLIGNDGLARAIRLVSASDR
jgi:hypothetical protein